MSCARAKPAAEPQRATILGVRRGALLAAACALLLSLVAMTAVAQEPEVPEIRAIALEDVIARAEATSQDLASMRPTDASSAALKEIEASLKELRKNVAERVVSAETALDAAPNVRRLRELENQLEAFLTRLTGPDSVLEAELGRVTDSLARLEETLPVWEATRKAASGSAASPQTIRRIQATRDEITQVQRDLVKHRNEILNVRDRMVDPRASLERVLALVKAEKQLRIESVLSFDREPIWSGEFWEGAGTELKEGWTAPLRDRLAETSQYAKTANRVILFQVLLFVSLVLGLRRLQAHAKQRADENYDLHEAEKVFEQPLSMALLLTLSLAPVLHPLAPNLFPILARAVATLPAVLIARRLAPPAMAPIAFAVPVLFLTDHLRDTLDTMPTVEHLLTLAELVGGLAFVLWLLRPKRMAQVSAEVLRSPSFRRVGAALRAVIALFALAIVSAAVGLGGLAELIGTGTLESAALALFAFVLLKVAQSLLAYALVLRPLRLLRMVARHRALVRRRLSRALELIAVGVWLYQSLSVFGLEAPLRAVFTGVFSAGVEVGALSVSVGDVAAFGFTVWFSLLLARFVDFVLQEDVFPRLELARGVPYAISSMVRYTMLFFGFLFALAATGIELSKLTVVAGGLGVGIGFGLQNIVNNFVSGLVLLFERPLKVGDSVQLPGRDVWGEIRRIGIRASVIRTFDGAEVIVPNGQLISDVVTNWTFSDRRRRVEVAVGVEYGTDAQRVLDLLLQVADSHERVLDAPKPLALFVGFGASSLDFLLRAWVADFDEGYTTRSELSVAIQRALVEADISVPFPQRDLHLRSMSPEVAREMRGSAPGGEPSFD